MNPAVPGSTPKTRSPRRRVALWLAFFLLLFVLAYVSSDLLSRLGEG